MSFVWRGDRAPGPALFTQLSVAPLVSPLVPPPRLLSLRIILLFAET